MIGDVTRSQDAREDSLLYGDFYKFLNIDPNDPWFDVKKKKPATDEDVSEIVIPDNLKPNFSFCPYVFDLKNHRLYFIVKSGQGVSAPLVRVKRLIEYLSNSQQIIDRFKTVNVSIIKDKQKVSELLAWNVIRTLEIYIERPNSDEGGDEKKALNKLNSMGANSERTVWRKARDVKSIVIDDETRRLANVAADNGVVKVTGRNRAGLPDRASSESYPMHSRATYDPDTGDLWTAFRSFVLRNFIK
jgi:hypothetical protein